MNVLSYILEVNFGLMITIALLISMRYTMSLAGMRIRARADVLMLRLSLIIVLVAPVGFEILRKFADLPRLSLEMVSPLGSAIDSMVSLGDDITHGPSILGAALVVICCAQSVAVLRQTRVLRRIRTKFPLTWRIGKIEIRRCDPGGMAFAFGDLKSTTIVVPDRLSSTERRAVLLHEIAHVRHRDLMWNWVINVASVTCIWNPFFWIYRQWYLASVEIAADQKVVQSRSIDVARYLKSLLSIASNHSTSDRTGFAVQSFFTAGRLGSFLIRRRITDALKKKQFSRSSFVSVLVIIVLILNWSVSNTELTVRNWSIQSLSHSTEINRIRLHFMLSTKYFDH